MGLAAYASNHLSAEQIMYMYIYTHALADCFFSWNMYQVSASLLCSQMYAVPSAEGVVT